MCIRDRTYIMAVNPQIEKGIYSVETDKYITSVPVFRDGELTTVRADFVTVFKGCLLYTSRCV